MIVESLFLPIFTLIKLVISFIPNGASIPSFFADTLEVVSRGLAFFPSDVWVIVLGNILFWLQAQLAWAIVEWLYKKIPGVD